MPPLPLKSLLRTDIASSGTTSLPLILVLGAIATVAYADHRVVSISLIYLYILPLTVGALFLRKELSYSLIAACILLHYFDSPRRVPLGIRIFHDFSALVCFTFVLYVIQKYMAQREALAKAIGSGIPLSAALSEASPIVCSTSSLMIFYFSEGQ